MTEPGKPQDDDLTNRVTVLENEVARLREEGRLTAGDAGAARVLAAGADHDVSEVRAELRAHTSALNALRETQLEQGHRIDALYEHIDVLHTTQLEQGQRMTDGFATLDTGMRQIVTLLGRLSDDTA